MLPVITPAYLYLRRRLKVCRRAGRHSSPVVERLLTLWAVQMLQSGDDGQSHRQKEANLSKSVSAQVEAAEATDIWIPVLIWTGSRDATAS